MRKLLLFPLAMLFWHAITAQEKNFWTPVNESTLQKNLFVQRAKPLAYKLFQLQESALKTGLLSTPSEKNIPVSTSAFLITIPNPDGELEEYRIVEAPVMHPELAARYPDIKSYVGQGVKNPSSTVRFDISPRGFHGVVLSPERPSFYIDPIDRSTRSYIIVSKKDMGPTPQFKCFTEAEKSKQTPSGSVPERFNNADDANLRTYRLAMAASGQYSLRFLSGEEPDDAARRAVVLAAMNTNLVRVNAIMERDFGVRLILIANNDDIIYLDPNADPFTSTDAGVLNDQVEAVMNSEIGAANYDIGHLVTELGNYGKAGCIGCVCSADNTKGRGMTSRANWTSGNGFEEYILVHEMGHQFDANHTFSHDDEGTIAQVEPGSGNTIMSYAGITGPSTDIQPLMDDYFHAISIQQASDYIKSQACNAGGASGNSTPTANAGADYTIPKSTPFKLTGIGTDADGGDILTFNWEQMDLAPSFPWLPSTTAGSGPAFKSVLPSTNTSRTFPVLANILDGSNTNKWEKLPSVARTLNFRFTVRDNHPGAGNNESDNMVVTVDATTGPFAITSPNTNVSWCPGNQTVTWSVNGSDALAANVNILLSTDGGISFPTVLAANTPNDGSQAVNIACGHSTTARIKVEAIGNIFFDISDANFTVGDNTPPNFTDPPDIIIFKDANCNYDASIGITGDVTDEADNCDNSLNATFADAVAPGSCVGENIITRTWTLTDDCGNATVKIQTITIKDNTPPTFTDPPDITIYKDNNCNHNASVGVTGDVTDEADNCDNTLNATFSDVTVPGSCIGEEIITRTWSLTDDCGNNTSKNQIITVKDTTRPVISNVSANPGNLWPPNHKMVLVTIGYNVMDNCSPAFAITNQLSVTSNEPVNGTGDGNTSPDWQVVDEHHVWLRAERKGNGNGRIYTVKITSTDDCGNVATTTVPVYVAHDMSGPVTNNILSEEERAKITGGLAVKVMPNPSTSSFNIYINSDDDKERIVIQVFDLFGRKVEERIANKGAVVRIGDNYQPGVYLVNIIQGNGRKEIKLIKFGAK
jgi:hypothetical protein